MLIKKKSGSANCAHYKGKLKRVITNNMLNFFSPKRRFQVVGWIGMILILVAYFLVSFDILTVHNIYFQLMNIVGSIGLVLVAMNRRDWQPMVLNIAWILIGIGAIINLSL